MIITLRNEVMPHGMDYFNILLLCRKADLQDMFDILGVGWTKSMSKVDLINVLCTLLHQDSARWVNALPKEEQKIFSKLLVMREDGHFAMPIQDKELMLHKLMFVFTFVDEIRQEWRLYMPDAVRKIINDAVNTQMELYPELKEMDRVLTEYQKAANALNDMSNILFQSGNRDRKRLQKDVAKIETVLNTNEHAFRALIPSLQKYDTNVSQILKTFEATKLQLAFIKMQI